MGRRHPSCRGGNEDGLTLVFVALILAFILGVAALALDVGYLFVVRAELQNAADAAALAGANQFYSHTPGTPSTHPDWPAAERAASVEAPPNQADGRRLTSYTVASGYWNLSRDPSGLQDRTITAGSDDVPAVRVTVRKARGENGGPVVPWFAHVIGVTESMVAATATAVCASPGSVEPGVLMPVAIPLELANRFRGTDTTVVIGSPYHYPNTLAGQWTSLNQNRNSVTYLRNLIENGNPTPVAVGDNIWIQPGVETTLYDNPNHPSIQRDYAGKDVILPVVDGVLLDNTHAWMELVGFIGFHVDYALGGSTKQIVGHFVPNIYTGRAGPAGPNYGVFVPPRLVQ